MNSVKMISIGFVGMLVLSTFVVSIDRAIAAVKSEAVSTASTKVNSTKANSVATSAESLDWSQVGNKIRSTLQLNVSSIAESPVPGLLQVMTERGLFYVTQDANYFVQGRIFNLNENMRNETEEALSSARLSGLETFKDNMIEYKAENEKYVVSVFTDITCGYCRKLHNQMAEYNDLGITVRYLAFPRAGLGSKPYLDMVSVWCADNPQKAMDDAKAGGSVAAKTCNDKVAEQYVFGQSMGVNGTPNIILPDGSVIPGYQPPAKLEDALKAIM